MSRLATPIRKNDNVVVITGKDRGKRGRVLRVARRRRTALIVEGVNIIKRHTKPNPQRNIKGGHRRARGAAARLERAAGVPRVRQADAARPQDARRRPQGAHLPQVRGSGRQMSRLKERYEKEVAPALKKEFGYSNVMAIPKIEKVVVNMGLGEATQNAKIVDTGADELARITGQKPVDDPREEVDRAVQGPQGHADRRDGHAARRADVGVPRPADLGRAAARPRLPRRVAARASTAAATTRSASRTSCCSPRSTT